MKTCPRCRGEPPTGAVFVDREDGSAAVLPARWCSLCGGTGEVTPEMYMLWRRGDERRRRRIARRESLRDAARRLGMTPAALSRLERGEGGR